jgi:hypothetical protein
MKDSHGSRPDPRSRRLASDVVGARSLAACSSERVEVLGRGRELAALLHQLRIRGFSAGREWW